MQASEVLSDSLCEQEVRPPLGSSHLLAVMNWLHA